MRDFLNRHMIMLGFVAVAAYSAYLYKNMWGKEEAARNTQSFNYEMPRPKAYYGDVDLSGRKVNRKVIRPEGANPVAQAILPKQDAVAPAAKTADKKVAAKDKDKDKKKKTAANAKKAGVRVAVVDGAEGMGLNRNSILGGSRSNAPVNNYEQQTAANNNADKAPKSDEAKMSASQWKSLLFAQPSSKNASEFLTAYKKGHIDSASFYEITHDLLKDTAQDRQKAALNILKAETSVKGFEILATEHAQQNDPLKTEIYTVLKTYSHQAKIATLARVLYHTDTEIVKIATDMITLAVQTQQNQGQSGNNSSGVVSAATFNQFIPALRRLSLTDDPALAATAQQLMSSIQSLSA